MKRKLSTLGLNTHVKIHMIILIIGMVITCIGAAFSTFGSLHPVAWIGLMVIAAGYAWRLIFVKCPYCGSMLLGMRTLPQYCPDCGEKLF